MPASEIPEPFAGPPAPLRRAGAPAWHCLLRDGGRTSEAESLDLLDLRIDPGELGERLGADLALEDFSRRSARQRPGRAADVARQLVTREVLGEERAQLIEVERGVGVDRRADLLAHAF